MWVPRSWRKCAELRQHPSASQPQQHHETRHRLKYDNDLILQFKFIHNTIASFSVPVFVSSFRYTSKIPTQLVASTCFSFNQNVTIQYIQQQNDPIPIWFLPFYDFLYINHTILAIVLCDLHTYTYNLSGTVYIYHVSRLHYYLQYRPIYIYIHITINDNNYCMYNI